MCVCVCDTVCALDFKVCCVGDFVVNSVGFGGTVYTCKVRKSVFSLNVHEMFWL